MDMRILVINSGSASSKLALYEVVGHRPRQTSSEHYDAGEGPPQALLERFLGKTPPRIDGVCHRIVHGGSRMRNSCLLSAEVEDEIERLAQLAPLHNPVALQWVKASRAFLGNACPHAAIFDTAFYANLPIKAASYALPRPLAEEHEIRRYGFHGIAHQAMWERWCQLRKDLPGGARLITVQLGGGCSMTATLNGTPMDTSMGFSPVEGLVMASRSGDLDPSVVTYLMRRESLTPEAVDQLLNEESGLKGLSDRSPDIRALLDADDPYSREAIALYCYRVRKYLGAYLAVLGGADGILFGGGVGEHAPQIRAQILQGMEWCGITLDEHANSATVGREGRISRAAGGIEVWVTAVSEGDILAREAYTIIAAAHGVPT